MKTVVKCNNCGCENTLEGLQNRYMVCWMCKKEVEVSPTAKFSSTDYLTREEVKEFMKNTEFYSGWKVRYYSEKHTNWITIGFPFTMNNRQEFDRWANNWSLGSRMKENEVNGYYCAGCDSIFRTEKETGAMGLTKENCPYCDSELTICEKVEEE